MNPFKSKSICWASPHRATQLCPLVLPRPWRLSTSSPSPASGTPCSRTQSTRRWWTTLTYSAFLSACCTPRSTAWRSSPISRSLTKRQLQASPWSRSISKTSHLATTNSIWWTAKRIWATASWEPWRRYLKRRTKARLQRSPTSNPDSWSSNENRLSCCQSEKPSGYILRWWLSTARSQARTAPVWIVKQTIEILSAEPATMTSQAEQATAHGAPATTILKTRGRISSSLRELVLMGLHRAASRLSAWIAKNHQPWQQEILLPAEVRNHQLAPNATEAKGFLQRYWPRARYLCILQQNSGIKIHKCQRRLSNHESWSRTKPTYKFRSIKHNNKLIKLKELMMLSQRVLAEASKFLRRLKRICSHQKSPRGARWGFRSLLHQESWRRFLTFMQMMGKALSRHHRLYHFRNSEERLQKILFLPLIALCWQSRACWR